FVAGDKDKEYHGERFKGSSFQRKIEELKQSRTGHIYFVRDWNDAVRKGSELQKYPRLSNIRKHLNPALSIDQRLWGIKLPSWKTHIVWDPIYPEDGFWYLKLGRSNYSSILINDYLQDIREDLLRNGIFFMPETRIIFGDVSGYYINSTLRDSNIFGLKEGQTVIPLYGLIGSRLNRDWTIEQFEDFMMEKFIPRIANTLAVFHHKYGLFPLMHTQNTLVVINEKTGEIEGLVLRDFADVLLDPYTMLKNGLLEALFKIGSGISHRLNQSNADGSSSIKNPYKNARMGTSFAGYAGQSIYYPFLSTAKQNQAVELFFSHYLETAIQIQGQTNTNSTPFWNKVTDKNSMFAKLSSEAQLWESENTTSLNKTLAQHNNPYGKLKAGMTLIMDHFRRQSRPTVPHSWFNYSSKTLRRQFRRSFLNNQVALIDEDSLHFVRQAMKSKRRALLAFDGSGVYLLDPESKVTKAIAYNLSEEEKNKIAMTQSSDSLLREKFEQRDFWDRVFNRSRNRLLSKCTKAI
ncbi:MAG: hypothetical protein KDD61_02560, partial [Bdellovibrionales bacterium]|nr:hypothetical protein [Bdellovibrionales bacterium]